MANKINTLIGERVRLARKDANLTQSELSDKLGFNDRQILSYIESGIRKISPDELLALMKHLGKTLEYFTDPYLLTGERIFSWRADRASVPIDVYEMRAKKLVGAFRQFNDLLGEKPNPIIPTLSLNEKSRFEAAQNAAEHLVEEWDLGDIPSKKLTACVEARLNMHVLYVDAPDGISGAACHLDEMNLILINRNDPENRRIYDLAHEIFHLLTWCNMQPEKIDVPHEGADDIKRPRVEQLADNFAAALLMPESSVKKYWNKNRGQTVRDRITTLAEFFNVSGSAMYWRLKNLGLLDDNNSLERMRFKHVADKIKPRLYSEVFVKKLFAVIDKGLVSVRKAADLLDCDIEDIEDLFKEYKMKAPFEV